MEWVGGSQLRVCRSDALSEVGAAGFPHCVPQLDAPGWAEACPIITFEAVGALGPMLPASARERWPV